MATYKTEGIILKQADLGEVDKILTIYTANFGKLQVKARGIKKITSKLASHLESFNYSQMMFAQGKTSLTLTDSSSVNNFLQIRSNLEKIALACYMIELLDKFTSAGEPDKQIFDLGRVCLTKLNSGSPNIYFPILVFYQLSLLEFLGYRPELKNCLHCHHLIKPGRNFFSSSLGGLLCPNCSKSDSKAPEITPGAIKVLRIFSQKDFSLIRRLRLDREIKKEVVRTLKHFSQFILGEELKSTKFLARCLF